MSDDLPYTVEYAKSSRAGCQKCKTSIQKDTLRLAVLVQSPIHDGKMTKWYHWNCFFEKQRPNSTADISNFDNIRWEDQQKIKEKIEEAIKLPSPTKGRKRGSNAVKVAGSSSGFLTEYAKSNKSTCKGCEEKIMKGEIRVSKKDFESDEGRKYGGIDRWYHLECFAKLRGDLQFYEDGDTLPGLNALSKEDQGKVKSALPKMKSDNIPPPVKKMKTEPEDQEEEKQLRKQNDEMYKIRDILSSLKKNDLATILEKNDQQIPEGVSCILDRLADMICFGALKPCPKCNGQLVYTSGVGYKCTGDLTEWTKCEYITQDPKRKKILVPKETKEAHPDVCRAFRSKVKKRIIKITAPSTSSLVKKEDEVDSGPKIKGPPKPLKHMEFVFIGKMPKEKVESLKKNITKLGGSVTSRIHKNLAAVISTAEDITKATKKMKEVESLDIQVVSEDFVEKAKEYTDSAIPLIKKTTISSWGGDPADRIKVIAEKSAAKKSSFERSGSGKIKLQVKGGGTVDPDSGLEDCAHVYQKGKDKYTATLILTDIQTQKNSYYKIQILKHDKKNKFWVFRNWGRIGTTIGGTKLEDLELNDCIQLFEGLYEEKTGNTWRRRENFVKVPHKMYPIEVDNGEEEGSGKLLQSDIASKLKVPVQELIRLIFDEANMKQVMAEFEIDTDKMPLGKVSKKQIQKAYAVLTDLQELLKNQDVERTTLIDASNKFYNLVPHNFGISGPKILDNAKEIQGKCEMLDALLEMEIAYSLLHGKTDQTKNPLDAHYEQLKTDIEVLEKDSELYKIIEQYTKNTHASTHTQYQLEIENVFVVKRQGEDKRYKPFKKLPNRKLLWHGSRTTNFAGILSQGLRIAPPEAPVTGYMFGKGIYFADMVSKSANYCCTNSQHSTGLLLLCEVALGNIYERYNADYIEKLPKGKHSTMGCGQTQPDPNCVYKAEDGVEIPYGLGVPVKLSQKSALLYNEYIVYDVAQVKAQYLVRMKFKY